MNWIYFARYFITKMELDYNKFHKNHQQKMIAHLSIKYNQKFKN